MYGCYLKWFGRFQHPLGWGWVPGWFVDPILWYPRYPQKMPNMAVFRPSRQKKNMFNMDENPSCSMGDTMKYNVIWCYTFMLDFQLVMWKIPNYTKSVEGVHNPWRNLFDRFPPKIRDTCCKKWTSEPSDPACLLEIDRSWSTRFMVGFPAMFTCLKMRHTPQKKSWCMVGYGRLWRSSWWSFCSSASTHLQSHSSNKNTSFCYAIAGLHFTLQLHSNVSGPRTPWKKTKANGRSSRRFYWPKVLQHLGVLKIWKLVLGVDKNKWKDKEEGLSERLQNSPLKMAVERFGLLICACVCLCCKEGCIVLLDRCLYLLLGHRHLCRQLFFVFDLWLYTVVMSSFSPMKTLAKKNKDVPNLQTTKEALIQESDGWINSVWLWRLRKSLSLGICGKFPTPPQKKRSHHFFLYAKGIWPGVSGKLDHVHSLLWRLDTTKFSPVMRLLQWVGG